MAKSFVLTGNMWAQQWNNIYDIVEPYKGQEEIDVTAEMLRQVKWHYIKRLHEKKSLRGKWCCTNCQINRSEIRLETWFACLTASL